MNLLEHYVTKVVSKSELIHYGDKSSWEVEVEYTCYGYSGESTLCFPTREEAEKVEVGYMYMA